MIKYRFCYEKFGDAKYVSHLDLIRLFSRAFKRAGIPLTYSEGFNPHPKLAIGLPLSVGVTSECEYMDAETDRRLTMEDFKELNRKMPIGIQFSAMGERALGTKKLSDISYAVYRVTARCTKISGEALQEFLQKEQILIEKKTKRKEEEADILPDIGTLGIESETETGLVFSMTLAAGPSANLKPDLVLSAMAQYIEGFSVTEYDIHRVSILGSDGKKML